MWLTFGGTCPAGRPFGFTGVGLSGLGPNSFEAYLSAERTYPANVISPAISEKAAKTFAKIAAKDAKVGDPKSKGQSWVQVGPQVNATQPGVLAFSGATNDTASRVTALVVSPSCGSSGCRVWAGVAGGGIWRTDNALAAHPAAPTPTRSGATTTGIAERRSAQIVT